MNKVINLQITGHIQVAQFWPDGDSDADTTKLLVSVARDSFKVKLPASDVHVPTQAFDHAFQHGEKKPDGSFKQNKLINSKGQITLRLQRVDAPELHISPGPIKGKSLAGTGLFLKYRQRQAETGTNALRLFLRSMADVRGLVPCTFDSNLGATQGPGDVVDKYGRFVGDIWVGSGPKPVNLNLWLLEQGWCVVALYDSMLEVEIDETLKAWRKGRGKGSRKMYRSKFEPFENLVFRKSGSPLQDEGDKKFIHPKYFRRYVTWFAHHNAGNFAGDYADYLESKDEQVYELTEFVAALQKGKKESSTYPLYERDFDGDKVGWAPERFIFLEAPSTVFTDQGGVERKLSKADW
jgi:endonuclease YncB( thermonuclease family)